MKITPQVLSIPPYISTTWSNILALHVKKIRGDDFLVIALRNGYQIEIPGLDKKSIAAIFEAHVQSIETASQTSIPSLKGSSEVEVPLSFSLPLKEEGGMIDAFGPVSQHNPDQADLPPLPPNVLKKIGAIASAFGMDALSAMPKSEPGCRCVYCQVMNVLQGKGNEEGEEEVKEVDLQFRDWDIEQKAEKLYNVTNPIDANEHYRVYLGEPLGCTCGQKNCEHIRAVLKT